jgi:hypothetical protein
MLNVLKHLRQLGPIVLARRVDGAASARVLVEVNSTWFQGRKHRRDVGNCRGGDDHH